LDDGIAHTFVSGPRVSRRMLDMKVSPIPWSNCLASLTSGLIANVRDVGRSGSAKIGLSKLYL